MCQNKQLENVPNIIIDHLFWKNFGRKGLVLFCKVVFNCLNGHDFLLMHSVTHACFGTYNKQSKDIIICLTSFTYFYGAFHPVCCRKPHMYVYIYTHTCTYICDICILKKYSTSICAWDCPVSLAGSCTQPY